jgi:hypothetical protein
MVLGDAACKFGTTQARHDYIREKNVQLALLLGNVDRVQGALSLEYSVAGGAKDFDHRLPQGVSICEGFETIQDFLAS